MLLSTMPAASSFLLPFMGVSPESILSLWSTLLFTEKYKAYSGKTYLGSCLTKAGFKSWLIL